MPDRSKLFFWPKKWIQSKFSLVEFEYNFPRGISSMLYSCTYMWLGILSHYFGNMTNSWDTEKYPGMIF